MLKNLRAVLRFEVMVLYTTINQHVQDFLIPSSEPNVASQNKKLEIIPVPMQHQLTSLGYPNDEYTEYYNQMQLAARFDFKMHKQFSRTL